MDEAFQDGWKEKFGGRSFSLIGIFGGEAVDGAGGQVSCFGEFR